MSKSLPKSFGVLLFPGFALLDACGPMEMLNGLSSAVPLELSMIAVDSLEPVSTTVPIESIPEEMRASFENYIPSISQKIVPTHTLETCPPLDVLIIPGGFGVPGATADPRVRKFVAESKAQTIITICNGAAILAATGLLDGRKATTNKWWYKDVTSVRPQVHWVHKARWVHDERFWSSSGISAGLDVIAAFMRETYGPQIGQLVPDILEYTPELNSDNDPFVDTWKKYIPSQQNE
ncbi:DJ-1/PfpI family protein [Umbelopsis sp. PMI_123]|nr:DJ-1/PfpI family protein [Umbelopsis sp. PMI_123]